MIRRETLHLKMACRSSHLVRHLDYPTTVDFIFHLHYPAAISVSERRYVSHTGSNPAPLNWRRQVDEKVAVVLKMKIEKVSGNVKWSDGWFIFFRRTRLQITPKTITITGIFLLRSSSWVPWVLLYTKTNALRERLATLKEQTKAREEELSNHRRRTFA